MKEEPIQRMIKNCSDFTAASRRYYILHFNYFTTKTLKSKMYFRQMATPEKKKKGKCRFIGPGVE